MLKKRNAEGMTMNVIVFAIISFLVLVLLIGILSGRVKLFTGAVEESQSCSQLCQIKDYSNGASEPKQEYEMLAGAKDGSGNQCYCKPKN